MRLTHFAGYALPVNNASDDMDIDARSSLITLPGGAFDMDGSRLVATSNQVRRSFVIVEDIDDTVDAVVAALAKGRRILKGLLRDEGTYRQTWGKTTSVSRRRTAVMAAYQELTVTWDRDYPYWMTTANEPKYLDNGEVFDDAWVLDAGNKTSITVAASPTAQTINNTGGCTIPKLRIVIVAGTSITDLRIYNKTTSQWIQYNGALVTGDVVEIQTLSKTVEKNNSDAYSSLAIGSDQVDWLELVTGNNELELTCAAITDTTTVHVYWSEHYL